MKTMSRSVAWLRIMVMSALLLAGASCALMGSAKGEPCSVCHHDRTWDREAQYWEHLCGCTCEAAPAPAPDAHKCTHVGPNSSAPCTGCGKCSWCCIKDGGCGTYRPDKNHFENCGTCKAIQRK